MHSRQPQKTWHQLLDANAVHCFSSCLIALSIVTLLKLGERLQEAEHITGRLRGLVGGHHEVLQRQQLWIILLHGCKVKLDLQDTWLVSMQDILWLYS